MDSIEPAQRSLAITVLSLEYTALRQEIAGRVGSSPSNLALIVAATALLTGLRDDVAPHFVVALVVSLAAWAACLVLAALRGLVRTHRMSRHLADLECQINGLIGFEQGSGLTWESEVLKTVGPENRWMTLERLLLMHRRYAADHPYIKEAVSPFDHLAKEPQSPP
jgi:hypothetical protein